MSDYDKSARYYDLIQSRFIDYSAEVKNIHKIFQTHNIHTVLDLACGTGSHLIELTKLGYQCTGIDLSSEMIKIASKKAKAQNLSINFIVANMKEYLPKQKFDAILGLYALTSLETNEDFGIVLANTHKSLQSEGLFYFNLLNANFEGMEKFQNSSPSFYMDVIVNKPGVRLVRFNQTVFNGYIQDWKTVDLIAEGNGVNLVVDTHKLRFHDIEEVKKELLKVGFQFISVNYSDVQSLKCWDMFILAQAGTLW